MPLREYTVEQYFWSPDLISDKTLVSKIDTDLVEHFEEPAMKRCLYGFLCILGMQYKYGKSKSKFFVSKPKEARADLWLSIISETELFTGV